MAHDGTFHPVNINPALDNTGRPLDPSGGSAIQNFDTSQTEQNLFGQGTSIFASPNAGAQNPLQILQNQSLQQIEAGGLFTDDLNEFGITNDQLKQLNLSELGNSLPADQLLSLQTAQQDLLKKEGGGFQLFDSVDPKTGLIKRGGFAPIANAAVGVGQLALGFKQLGQSERALDLQQDAFERNFAAQEESINNRLADREYRRLRRGGASHENALIAGKKHADKFGVGQN